MAAIAYVIDLIKYSAQKNKAADGEEIEKPKWPVSIVALIVTALFIVYFFVPVAL
jgi:hypothetical protein